PRSSTSPPKGSSVAGTLARYSAHFRGSFTVRWPMTKTVISWLLVRSEAMSALCNDSHPSPDPETPNAGAGSSPSTDTGARPSVLAQVQSSAVVTISFPSNPGDMGSAKIIPTNEDHVGGKGTTSGIELAKYADTDLHSCRSRGKRPPRRPFTQPGVHHPATRTHFFRIRSVGPDDRRLQAAFAAGRDGAGRSSRDRGSLDADRRGGDRHRQDLRLPGAGPAGGRQSDRFDGHQDSPGPALPPRYPDGAQGACRAGDGRVAQRSRELRVSLLPGANEERRPLAVAGRCRSPGADRALCTDFEDR